MLVQPNSKEALEKSLSCRRYWSWRVASSNHSDRNRKRLTWWGQSKSTAGRALHTDEPGLSPSTTESPLSNTRSDHWAQSQESALSTVRQGTKNKLKNGLSPLHVQGPETNPEPNHRCVDKETVWYLYTEEYLAMRTDQISQPTSYKGGRHAN